MSKSPSLSEKPVRPARVVSPHRVKLSRNPETAAVPTAGETCLARILRSEKIAIHFQPIVSLKKKSVLGLEALARPMDTVSGQAVSPIELFSAAIRAGNVVE